MSTEYQLILMNGKIIHILYPSLDTRAVSLMLQVKLEPTLSASPRSLKSPDAPLIDSKFLGSNL